VRRVAVLAREDRPGERRLVAYYDGPAAPSATSAGAALRDFLRARLPEFMIPAAFVSLPELALNRNGKVDRAALPPPESLAEATEAAPLHALSPAEELLLGIWREVLDNPAFGPDESFFEAGGHSLLATQVVSRVRRVFGVEIPLRALFEAPTVSGLARRIEDESGVTVPAVQRVPREGRDAREAGLPLSYAQQRLWFLDQLLADRSSYNVPSALRFSGRLNVPVLERALGEVFRRHEVLRTTFQEAGGVPVQVPGEAPRGALPVVDLSGLAAAQPGAEAAEAARLQAAEAARPFDLARGPLLRAAVLRLGAEEHLGLFTMHHIASDGWSMGVLVREVGALYAAFSAGQPSPLPELPLQYADYAVWQRRWMRGEVLEEHLAAWRRRLHGPLPPFPLPLDRPRPAVPGSRGGRRSFALPAALLQELKALSRHEDATLYMTLLAAFSALLARTGGQTDVLVGSAVAGRSLAETEGLIGFFINMLPMRVDLSGNPRFRELLARVRDTALDAYTHQHLPFDKLVEELQPDRGRTGQAPLFQIAFGLQNAQTPETLELPGVAVTALPPEHEVARYDLTVWARETGDGLDVLWTYSAELFEPATVANLHGRFEAVLRQVAERPGIHLDALEILGDEERRAQAAEQAGQRQEKHRKLLRLQPKAFKQPPAVLRGGEETS
jgi:acyl carrier protein